MRQHRRRRALKLFENGTEMSVDLFRLILRWGSAAALIAGYPCVLIYFYWLISHYDLTSTM